MSKLRESVRKTIDTGAATWAVVESFQLGLATVRLTNNGARLTNLNVMGGNVNIGDLVIVDYSAGVKPIVRPPLYAKEEYLTEIPLEIAEPITADAAGESFTPANGIGFRLISYDTDDMWFDSGTPYRPLPRGQWVTLFWDYSQWGATIKGTSVRIPASGFYLVSAFWDEAINCREIIGIKNNQPVQYIAWDFSGYYHLQVKCNGDVILQSTSRDFETILGHFTCHGTMFGHFDGGDVLEMQLRSGVRVDNFYDMGYPIEGLTYATYASHWWRRTLTVHCVVTG